jgi:hypothetical protein
LFTAHSNFASTLNLLINQINDNVKDGFWVVLSNLEIIKLNKDPEEAGNTEDSDGDGIPDRAELIDKEYLDSKYFKGWVWNFTTDPSKWDTDNDGISDGPNPLPDAATARFQLLANDQPPDDDADGLINKDDPDPTNKRLIGLTASMKNSGQSVSYKKTFISKTHNMIKSHPTWVMNFKDTGTSINRYASALDVDPRKGQEPDNLIAVSKSYPSSYYSSKDTNIYQKNYRRVSVDGIKYFLDPINWLTESTIFQYSDLRSKDRSDAGTVTQMLSVTQFNQSKPERVRQYHLTKWPKDSLWMPAVLKQIRRAKLTR